MICSQDGVDVWQLNGVGDTHLVGNGQKSYAVLKCNAIMQLQFRS